MRKDSPARVNMNPEPVSISTSDGLVLDGLFTAAENSSAGIVYAHGLSVDKDDEGIFVKGERELNKLGFSTLRFDFRGHGKDRGESKDRVIVSGELEDLDAACSWMRHKGINWIGIAGGSFGGSIAALYAGTHPDTVKALFLANPVLDYEAFLRTKTDWQKQNFLNLEERLKQNGYIEFGSRKFKLGAKFFEGLKEYRPSNNLLGYHGPLLIVHGTEDDKVLLDDTKARFMALPHEERHWEFLSIDGAQHGFHIEPYETNVVRLMVDFFAKTHA